MLEYDRIDISEGSDVNKTSLSKECDTCHYWHFKYIGFKYEPIIFNIFAMTVTIQCKKLWVLILLLKAMIIWYCYDIVIKSYNIDIVYVKGSAYGINFWCMSKDDAINIRNGSYLVHKMDVS